jgi:hypothetical protein
MGRFTTITHFFPSYHTYRVCQYLFHGIITGILVDLFSPVTPIFSCLDGLKPGYFAGKKHYQYGGLKYQQSQITILVGICGKRAEK